MRRLDYEHDLEAVRGSPLTEERVQCAVSRFLDFYAHFTPDGIAERIEATYAEEVVFDDTLKRVEGRRALREYATESATLLHGCTVECAQVISAGNDLYVRWAMTLRFKKLAAGRPQRTVGISHLRLDSAGRIALHQDFWDSARGLYDHVPLLGTLMRWVRRRL